MGMDKYIDREAFLEDAEERYCLPCKGAGKDHNGLKCRACWVDDMCGDIIGAPTADVAPVRHGQWEEMHYEGGILDGTNYDRCSICGYERVFDDPALKTVFKYCPNCGADMRGSNDE